MHAAAGVRRERREVETARRRSGPAPARAAEDELVVQLRGAAVDPPRRQERDVPACGRARVNPAARRSTSSSSRFAVRSASASGGTCEYAQAVSLPAGARVASADRVLPEEHERPLRLAALRDRRSSRSARRAIGQVDDRRAARRLGGPRDGAVERPVDLDDRGVGLDVTASGRDRPSSRSSSQMLTAASTSRASTSPPPRLDRPRVRCARGHARPACR